MGSESREYRRGWVVAMQSLQSGQKTKAELEAEWEACQCGDQYDQGYYAALRKWKGPEAAQ